MTAREKVLERIANMDDAALAELLNQIERVERSRNRFSKEFFDALSTVHERNKDLSGEEALQIATEAVNSNRQRHH